MKFEIIDTYRGLDIIKHQEYGGNIYVVDFPMLEPARYQLLDDARRGIDEHYHNLNIEVNAWVYARTNRLIG